jgi:hypothetical protein
MLSKHVYKQLSAYCHGELSSEEMRRVAEHLRLCERCRKEYDEIKLGVFFAKQLTHVSAPDSLWDEIETALAQPPARVKWQLKLPRLAFVFESPRLAMASAALLLALGLGGAWLYLRLSRPAWDVEMLEGTAKVGSKEIRENGKLALGQWIETEENARARITVGEIGHVEVDPQTRLRLDQSRPDDHRLTLERGTMHATIDAPPRYFSVATPSAVAVDLGCAYTLEVDESGAGLLKVTFGWVAFEVQGRESFIPRWAECHTRPGSGPGTPYYREASEAFKAALLKLDFEKLSAEERNAALSTVLNQARKDDAFTLWHLLTRTGESERIRVYERLAALVPPPNGVTRDGVLEGDRAMLDRWWDELGLMDTTWWRKWKGPWPPQTK